MTNEPSHEDLARQHVADKIGKTGQDPKTWAILHPAEVPDHDIDSFLEWLGYEEPQPAYSDLLNVAEHAANVMDELGSDADAERINEEVSKRLAKQTHDQDVADRVRESVKYRDVFTGELKAVYQKYSAFFGYTTNQQAEIWSGQAVANYLKALKEAEINGGAWKDVAVGGDPKDPNRELHRKAVIEAWENTTAALEFEEPEYIHQNLAEALKDEPEPERYRIDELLTEGSTCAVVARAKAGKTTLVMNLMKALADGTPFLGKNVTPVDGTVCYWDLELTYSYQLDRFRQIGIERPEKIVNRHLQGYATALSTAIGQEFAVKDLTAAGADIWIIDTFGAAFDGEDENHNSQVRKFFKGVDRVKRLAGIKEVIIIFHTGKGESTKARGASATEDWPAVIWEYGSTSGKTINTDDSRRHLHVYGRLAPQDVYLDYDSGVLALIDKPDGGRVSDKPQQIIDFLTLNPDSSQTEITEGIGLNKNSRSMIRPHLDELVKIGQVKAEDNGSGKTKTYSVNPAFDSQGVGSF